jgi:hypothetical protein
MPVPFILPASGPTGRRIPVPAHDRLDRLAAIDAEHKEMALTFLSGYAPNVFDDVLDATEPSPATARRRRRALLHHLQRQRRRLPNTWRRLAALPRRRHHRQSRTLRRRALAGYRLAPRRRHPGAVIPRERHCGNGRGQRCPCPAPPRHNASL